MYEEIEYKGTLKNLQLENILICKVVEQVKRDFPDLTKVKMDVDLINLICDEIEDCVKVNKLTKVNKLELFFKIYGIIFQFDGNERNHIVKIVESLHANGRIKVKPLLKKIFRFVLGYITPKK